jgi:hypothetical protein
MTSAEFSFFFHTIQAKKMVEKVLARKQFVTA